MKTDIDYQANNEQAVEFVRTWRTTYSALEALATRHNDTLFVLDEMSRVDSNKASEVACMLGNSQGKGRRPQECPDNQQAQIDG